MRQNKMAYRTMVADDNTFECEYVGYGWHATKRLAKKHAKQLALLFPDRVVIRKYSPDGWAFPIWWSN
jgi:hypothetical protein